MIGVQPHHCARRIAPGDDPGAVEDVEDEAAGLMENSLSGVNRSTAGLTAPALREATQLPAKS